eukprot:9189217-Alexandrium_andersonii.AAC.1
MPPRNEPGNSDLKMMALKPVSSWPGTCPLRGQPLPGRARSYAEQVEGVVSASARPCAAGCG